MNNNIILSLLLGIFASQKQEQSLMEEGFTKAFNSFLSNPELEPFLTELHSQGYLNQDGYLTNYGAITLKKITSNTKNPKQLNFERLCKNSTPGYNFALGVTAMNRFFEQVNEGIVKVVTPELEESAAQLCDNVTQFLSIVEIEN